MGHTDRSHRGSDQPNLEAPVPLEEREAIIQDIVSTQMLAGIELDYETAAAFDEAYRMPMPILDDKPKP